MNGPVQLNKTVASIWYLVASKLWTTFSDAGALELKIAQVICC